MPLSPRLYHWFVRPRWFTRRYIHDHINSHYHLNDKTVLDFGAGTGGPDVKRVNLAKRLYPNHKFMPFDHKRIPIPDQSMDYIFVVAVLHHIPDDQIKAYLSEFERILKPGGEVIVIEPYLGERTLFRNRFMKWYDDGEYIRNEEGYMNLFHAGRFECQKKVYEMLSV